MRYGWTLDRVAWKRLSGLVSELQWRNVPFERLHATAIPETPGVYLVCARTPIVASSPFADFFNVFYAGVSTTSIRTRFIYHCDTPDDGIRNVKECFGFNSAHLTYYFAKADASLVHDIEERLIDCYGPPCNRQAGRSPIIPLVLGSNKPAG